MQNIKTLEQYNKKYRNGRYKLLKYSKKEVEAFDKEALKSSINTKNYLLKGRKWVLIGDTYYEIPRPIRFTWARNVNAGVKALTCCLVGGAVIGGAGYGIYYLIKNKQPVPVPFDGKVTDDEWNKELRYLSSFDSRNFTVTYVDKYSKITYFEDKNREKQVVESQKILNGDIETNYRCKNGDTFFEFTEEGKKWQEISGKNANFYFDYDLSSDNIDFKEFINHKEDFEFKNSEYVKSNGSKKDPIEIGIKFSKDKKISNLTLKALDEENSDYVGSYTFSSYENTSFKFPEEPPEPTPAPEYTKYLSFSLDDNQKAIVKLKEGAASIPTELNTIPSKVDGKYCGGIEGQEYNVEIIGSSAFKEDTTIKKVIIPNNIKNIQIYAFQNSAVTEVHFNDQTSVWKQINGEAITITNDESNATNLKNCVDKTSNNWGFSGIEIDESADPEYLKYLDFNVQDADVIVSTKAESESFPETLVIPESVDGKYLKLVEGRKYNVTVIASEGFAKNNNLTSVVIPNKVKTISTRAFSGCENLKSIIFGSNLVKIGESAFEACGTKQSTGINIEIPESVSCISQGAFKGAKISNATFKSTTNWLDSGGKEVESTTFADVAKCAEYLTKSTFVSGLTKNQKSLRQLFNDTYKKICVEFCNSKFEYKVGEIIVNGEDSTKVIYPASVESSRTCTVTTTTITEPFLVATSTSEFGDLIEKAYNKYPKNSYYSIDSTTGDLSFSYIDDKNLTRLSIIINKFGYLTYLNKIEFGDKETYSITYKVLPSK